MLKDSIGHVSCGGLFISFWIKKLCLFSIKKKGIFNTISGLVSYKAARFWSVEILSILQKGTESIEVIVAKGR